MARPVLAWRGFWQGAEDKMARLEELTVGSRVKGLLNGDNIAEILSIKRFGDAALEVTYKDNLGELGNQMLYREHEAGLTLEKDNLPWSFSADGDIMRLVSEAYRIKLAHLFDPYLAVHTSSVEPLPHQISAVYQEMLPRLPLRYILADDPGAGKTIMTGLLLKELIVRGDLKRCLIVSPGSLSEQWQDEMFNKFHLKFEILTNDRLEAAVSGNAFSEINFCIARLDKLARNENLQQKLKETEWDLIVVDEAHKMAASISGDEVKYTKRFLLGKMLSNITRHFLLLTATPHNGKEADFQLFLSLIDPDRFEGVKRSSAQKMDVSDIMRRLVKEDLLKFDGRPLFPERRAYTVNYDLSPGEAELYREVTEYVRHEFDRADKLSKGRKTTVGFALTILQRRLASSPEAIYESLKRRRERLESRLKEEKLGRAVEEYQPARALPDDYLDDDYDEEDFTPEELEEAQENIAVKASAAASIQEMEAEIARLKKLEKLAQEVRFSGEDRKWEELSRLLQDEKYMFDPDGQREKLIIFTEHRDTLNYLATKIRTLFGREEAVVAIHGSMLREERHRVEERFKQDKEVRILIATDAAGEGINLQRAHLMINYDLPWNPNRLEQRFGRIHRIGQTEVCHLWNLVSPETREGMVFKRLLEKLEEERNALGGKVFDILGNIKFDNRPLKELLIEAIRYGNDPKVRERLQQVVDSSMSKEKFSALIAENALTEDTMDLSKVQAIRAEMERIEAHKLQPYFIEAYFRAALQKLGGSIHQREDGRYEITSVPAAIINSDKITGFGKTITKRYERIAFEKDKLNIPGRVPAEFICPGHPLLEATSAVLLERYGALLKQGTVFVDENDFGLEERLLFYIEDTIQDGLSLPSGPKRVISKNMHFAELKKDGTAVSGGYAPYLDYRALKEEEKEPVYAYIKKQEWLAHGVEERAETYAVTQIMPAHYARVKAHKLKMLDKIEKAVKERLEMEIRYWDYRAGELQKQEAEGKGNQRLTAANAARRADELQNRLNARLNEIAAERRISTLPPRIIGGSLVIPKGLLAELMPKSAPDTFSLGDRQAVEYAGMKAVMDIERRLGFSPKDVSGEKVGYDIESEIPQELREDDGASLRFIEVKSRIKGASTVTVTKNEISCALNKGKDFILAIVEVEGDKSRTTYLKKPFKTAPEFAATSVNYDIAVLMANAEVVYKE